jgi:hypothetical protein
MNQSDSMSGNNGVVRTPGDWDVDTLTEQIFGDLEGVIPRSTIQEVLNEVIPRYEEARIQTFIPIFIRRDAVNQLKSMHIATPGMAINKANTNETVTE